MKKFALTKFTSALLIFIFILSLVSCNGDNEKFTFCDDARIEIVTEDIVYSDDFIESARERFTSLAINASKKYFDITLKEKDKNEINESFTTTFLPIFYRIKIYEGELLRLLESAEAAISQEESASPVDIYESALYTLGSHRCGILFFEISKIILEEKEATSRERYEKYGDKRYFDDAEKYLNLTLALDEMGDERFVYVISSGTFILSSIISLNKKTEENSFLLNDAELLHILSRQADAFTSSCPTDAEWQTIGALITELIPTKADGLENAALYALKKDEYFNRASRAMPHIISLYASLASHLKADAAFSLSGESEENRRALICALLASENEIKALDAPLTKYAKIDSEHLEAAVVANADADALSSFTEGHAPIDCDEFISIIKDARTDASVDIKGAIISYASSLSPYLAFVIFN